MKEYYFLMTTFADFLLVLEIDLCIVCWLRGKESCIAWNKHDFTKAHSCDILLISIQPFLDIVT